MPLILPAERRSLRAILFHGLIVVLLALGSVTMLYPFAITVATSFTSNVDYRDWRLIPRYFHDDVALYRKYLEARYGKDRPFFLEFQSKHRLEEISQYTQIEAIPEVDLDDPHVQCRVEDWDRFRRELPERFMRTYFFDANYLEGRSQKVFQRYLRNRFDHDLAAFNAHLGLGIPFKSFHEVNVPDVNLEGHGLRIRRDPLRDLFLSYREEMPLDLINPLNFDQIYQARIRGRYADIGAVNRAWGRAFPGFLSIRFPTVRPEGEEGAFWAEFMRKRFPIRFVKVRSNHAEAYRGFLAERYQGEARYNRVVDKFNAESGLAIPALADTVFPSMPPETDFEFQNWKRFIDKKVPLEQLIIETTHTRYHDWLGRNYGTVEALNGTYGAGYAAVEEAELPWVLADAAWFKANRNQIKREFITANYRMVWSFMSQRGRAFWNTIVLVVLSVIGALTIQPMAAFALSRYRFSYKHKVLIFLIATMSFPAEVTMIPNFLLLREFHLLNTYAALILPGLVSGISIFYLKGFFDSLPRELYEAGMIDGASEPRMFWEITMPLSKPILAVIGLNAFTAAYGGFMWALLICQEEKMWTLMVFLYQFSSQNKPPPAQMAAFVLAGIPTLLVFIFAQKTIMRGIIVPTMK